MIRLRVGDSLVLRKTFKAGTTINESLYSLKTTGYNGLETTVRPPEIAFTVVQPTATVDGYLQFTLSVDAGWTKNAITKWTLLEDAQEPATPFGTYWSVPVGTVTGIVEDLSLTQEFK